MIEKLDLKDYINQLNSFFAREKNFEEVDIYTTYKYIKQLERIDFTPPSKVKNLDKEILHIKKFGILTHEQIFEFIKIINYFLYLKKLNILSEWLDKIQIPKEIIDISKHYTKKGEIIGFSELEEIDEKLKKIKEEIAQKLNKYINSSKMQSFLVDRQIHLYNSHQTLLVRGGFNKVINASILGRSSSGYFYILPQEVEKLKEKEKKLFSLKEDILYEIAKEFSAKFKKWIKFLEFINKEFDKFDHIQARLNFAKTNNLEFLLPQKSDKFILKDFCHPALNNCKPINLEWDKRVLIITGVNAGGKTMLLKSILTSAYMAKYLLPMKIKDGIIPHFKFIKPIIDDPQNVKNDISTFAGRIKEFKDIFSKENGLIGVDEIELGTDTNEAATLFKVIIEELLKKHKIVITTHHKKLASLLSSNEDVELLAAIYDEKLEKPTFEFIKGTIGKSYAFETAKRYGIRLDLINKAKKEYSEDLEKLENLIEKSAQLELEQKKKLKEIENELENIKLIKEKLLREKEEFNEKMQKELAKLKKEYNLAISQAKEAIKAKSSKEAHKYLNKATSIKKEIKEPKQETVREFKVGDNVKYLTSQGTILEIKKNNALVEIDGKKLYIPLSSLKPLLTPKKISPKIYKPKPSKIDIKLDLHGLRLEEALEKTEKYLNDAALAGLEEVWIYHGMGKGILAKGITDLLKNHPLVKEFKDAPPHMGGYGAKIVKL